MPPTRVWKELTLISPEQAAALGVPAEAPVLMSPVRRSNQFCFECNVNFGPLVYPIGPHTSVTTMHAKPSCPGIYHHHARDMYDSLVSYGTIWFFAISTTLCPMDGVGLRGNADVCSALHTMAFTRLTVRCVSCRTFRAKDITYTLDLDIATRGLMPMCESCGLNGMRPLWPPTAWTLRLDDHGVPSYRYNHPQGVPTNVAHTTDTSEAEPEQQRPRFTGGLIRSRT